ncbi:MAG: hypothetical protein RL748_548, partial [Pseudomonadota bacterium]
MSQLVDVAIIGAGPAGLVAALRMQQLGYRVLLIGHSSLPHAQIGEALTPGVKSMLDLLNAQECINKLPVLERLPTRMCWQKRQPEPSGSMDNAMVDHAAFSAALLQLARERNILVHLPAHIDQIKGDAGDWQIQFSDAAGEHLMLAAFLLDAQGRHGNSSSRIACAPSLLAIRVEFSVSKIAPEFARTNRMEACEQGWLWGSPLPDQRYRLMFCCDPHSAHNQAEALLRQQCKNSQLFAALADLPFDGKLQADDASAYMDGNSYQPGRLKLGDAAFALDPLSQSGVEK